ncbi:helix-turn-helix transcriptional regulator [Streptomyces sp. NBC_00102]|uniref:helix-turn-helix domain-containing protein n=1 Tax=Streptomyces sp. NBC_00102 TaxID=2975652 RepID=UPI00225B6C24|nr:helix-turn-helix transcriptional regulator [Streptomyces sp. NBC_00102]MCX5399064.1 helix-turn-helix transcriptional regulator [Streptomyces sp. NBC_00102]
MPSRKSSPPPHPAQLAFAAELREMRRRTEKKPTDETIARRMGCGRSTVSAIVNGRRFPNWENTAAFAVALGVDPSKLRRRWTEVDREIEEASKAGSPLAQHSLAQPSSARLPSTQLPLAQNPLAQLPLLGAAQAGGEAQLAAHWYRNNREFYEAAADRVARASTEIRVTYTRRYPPTQYTTPASADYFRAILDWAGEDSADERSVRRIIGIPERDGRPDGDMLDWAREHHEETRGILTYEANAMRWNAAADGLNMALIDDSVVFLAFSGGPRQKLNGLSIEDPMFMSYFAAYFDQLWAALPPLGTYLDEVADRAEGL